VLVVCASVCLLLHVSMSFGLSFQRRVLYAVIDTD